MLRKLSSIIDIKTYKIATKNTQFMTNIKSENPCGIV
jgi:hypothetical protein